MRLRIVRAAASVAVGAAAVALAGGCHGHAPAVDPKVHDQVEATITIVPGAMNLGASAYSPNPDTVAVGTAVRWRNTDDRQHTVTAEDGRFDLVIPAGESKSQRFDAPGSFPYHCRMPGHEMTGILVVR